MPFVTIVHKLGEHLNNGSMRGCLRVRCSVLPPKKRITYDAGYRAFNQYSIEDHPSIDRFIVNNSVDTIIVIK